MIKLTDKFAIKRLQMYYFQIIQEIKLLKVTLHQEHEKLKITEHQLEEARKNVKQTVDLDKVKLSSLNKEDLFNLLE